MQRAGNPARRKWKCLRPVNSPSSIRRHHGRLGKYARNCLADCLSQAKNILNRRAVDITSSLNVNVPNSCQDCCINTWTSGTSIFEKLFLSDQSRIEAKAWTAPWANFDHLKLKCLVDWMLFHSLKFFLRQHYVDRILQPQHRIRIEARQRHLSYAARPL